MWIRMTLVALFVMVAATERVLTQASTAVRGLNGSWEAYPIRGEGFGSGIAPKTKVAAPAPIPEPPLKQPFLDEWRTVQTRSAELTKKGLPPPSTGMACMPEGMPGMMGATFPMEILETPGQITCIQEAFTQVRRVYLGAAPEPAFEESPAPVAVGTSGQATLPTTASFGPLTGLLGLFACGGGLLLRSLRSRRES